MENKDNKRPQQEHRDSLTDYYRKSIHAPLHTDNFIFDMFETGSNASKNSVARQHLIPDAMYQNMHRASRSAKSKIIPGYPASSRHAVTDADSVHEFSAKLMPSTKRLVFGAEKMPITRNMADDVGMQNYCRRALKENTLNLMQRYGSVIALIKLTFNSALCVFETIQDAARAVNQNACNQSLRLLILSWWYPSFGSITGSSGSVIGSDEGTRWLLTVCTGLDPVEPTLQSRRPSQYDVASRRPTVRRESQMRGQFEPLMKLDPCKTKACYLDTLKQVNAQKFQALYGKSSDTRNHLLTNADAYADDEDPVPSHKTKQMDIKDSPNFPSSK